MSRVVITDANILINLIHIGQLPLLGSLVEFDFVVPDEVVAEILNLNNLRLSKKLFKPVSSPVYPLPTPRSFRYSRR